MNDRYAENPLDELEPAVQAVLSEPVPEEAVKRVKACAESLDGPVASPGRRGKAGPRGLARYIGVAAAMTLAITGGLWLFLGRSAGPAFAQTIKHVQEATSLEVTGTMTSGGGSEKIKIYLKEDRLRMERDGSPSIIVCDLKLGTALYQNVREKRYQLDDVSERLAEQIMPPIDQLRRAKPDDAEYVGEERVNGRLAVLYRMRDPEFLGVGRRGEMLLWVDPSNSLPVRIVFRGASRKVEVRFEDFRWNQPLDDGLFSLEPPEGYVEGSVLTTARAESPGRAGAEVSPSQLAKGVLAEGRTPLTIVWSPEATTITAITLAGARARLEQWNVASGKLNWSERFAGPLSLACSADGKTLGTLAMVEMKERRYRELQLRDASTGKVVRKWHSKRSLSSLAFSPDGKTLAAGVAEHKSAEGGIQIWGLERGELQNSWSADDVAMLVQYSPDGRYVAAVSGGMKIWDAETGEFIRGLPNPGPFDFSPNGEKIACRAESRHEVQVYEWRTGESLRTLAAEEAAGEPGVAQIDFSPDGCLVVAANRNGTVTLWDAATGEVVRTITSHKGSVLVAVFSPDGQMLATGGKDETLRLWRVDGLVE